MQAANVTSERVFGKRLAPSKTGVLQTFLFIYFLQLLSLSGVAVFVRFEQDWAMASRRAAASFVSVLRV